VPESIGCVSTGIYSITKSTGCKSTSIAYMPESIGCISTHVYYVPQSIGCAASSNKCAFNFMADRYDAVKPEFYVSG